MILPNKQHCKTPFILTYASIKGRGRFKTRINQHLRSKRFCEQIRLYEFSYMFKRQEVMSFILKGTGSSNILKETGSSKCI